MFQLRLGSIILGLLLAAPLARASALCATVVDFASFPANNASVIATNLATGKSYAERSDKQGKACFRKIPEGLYAVEAALAGFLNVRYFPVHVSPEQVSELSIVLPVGEVGEGGLTPDATVTGTLVLDGAPAQGTEICLVAKKSASRKCTTTDDLGEYVLVLPPEDYNTQVRARSGKVYRFHLDASVPGLYSNRLTLDDSAK